MKVVREAKVAQKGDHRCKKNVDTVRTRWTNMGGNWNGQLSSKLSEISNTSRQGLFVHISIHKASSAGVMTHSFSNDQLSFFCKEDKNVRE